MVTAICHETNYCNKRIQWQGVYSHNEWESLATIKNPFNKEDREEKLETNETVESRS